MEQKEREERKRKHRMLKIGENIEIIILNYTCMYTEVYLNLRIEIRVNVK